LTEASLPYSTAPSEENSDGNCAVEAKLHMNPSSPFLVVSQPDVSILGQINCARRRLLVVAPGLTEELAQAVASKWVELGRDAVRVVLDPDPDICRLGYGDLAALQLLHRTAAELGTTVLEQGGIRIGIVLTDETTTIFAPTPRLVEAGGEPGERMNAVRFDLPGISESIQPGSTIDVATLDLHAHPLSEQAIADAAADLSNDPPLKFDVTQKIRVFNTLFEFVELELNGMSLGKKKVNIPSELLGLAGDQEDRELLNSTCNLIDATSALSGQDLMKARQKIDDDYLTSLPGYGKVILRSHKEEFLKRIDDFKTRIEAHKQKVEETLAAEIEAKRLRLFEGLKAAILANPPKNWVKACPQNQRDAVVMERLDEELRKAFGKVETIVGAMEVKVLFKGVTYEMLSEPKFLSVASDKLPSLEKLHREFSAVEAKQG
jgi:hypothetical protein